MHDTSRSLCLYSSVTVAASDESDVFAYFSNYGSCVDIIGPVSQSLCCSTYHNYT